MQGRLKTVNHKVSVMLKNCTILHPVLSFSLALEIINLASPSEASRKVTIVARIQDTTSSFLMNGPCDVRSADTSPQHNYQKPALTI